MKTERKAVSFTEGERLGLRGLKSPHLRPIDGEDEGLQKFLIDFSEKLSTFADLPIYFESSRVNQQIKIRVNLNKCHQYVNML